MRSASEAIIPPDPGHKPSAKSPRTRRCHRPTGSRPWPPDQRPPAGHRPRRPRCAIPARWRGAAGEPGRWSGRAKLERSSRVPPSDGCSITISVRESGMPMTVSRDSPSTNLLFSASRPSATKNAVTASRSKVQLASWHPGATPLSVRSSGRDRTRPGWSSGSTGLGHLRAVPLAHVLIPGTAVLRLVMDMAVSVR